MSSDRALKRRREEAFPEEEEKLGGDYPLAVPIIKGNMYKDEEPKTCPRCEGQLMWYVLRLDTEMQACSNPVCEYPFDDSTSSFVVRDRLPESERPAINSGEKKTLALTYPMKQEDSKVEEGGASASAGPEMSLVLYDKERREKVKEYTNQMRLAFLNTPKESRRRLFTHQPGHHDLDAFSTVVKAIKSINEEETAKEVD